MISLISFTFSIYLMFRFILDIDADAGEGRTLPLMISDEEDPEDVDVVDNNCGLVLFVSDQAKERLLMSADWQKDGTFKTMKTKFFRQV